MIPKNFQFTCFLSSGEIEGYPIISQIKTRYVIDKIYIYCSLSFDIKIIIWQKRIRIGFGIKLYNE
ncbi:MAG: hypothetical protein NZ608_07775 [candidate division WOR-3 bacterium]|nr:hypothetical protein [candidate division WOR-3 bacterium]